MRNTRSGSNLSAPWQAIEQGNADEAVRSNTLAIKVPIEGDLIDALTIAPNPFTPNGDGVNDAVDISLEVFKLTSSRVLEVRIYTLDGHRVWGSDQMVLSGHSAVAWNGINDIGQVVPPGLYICQVRLNADDESGAATRSQVIAVAY